MTNKYMYFIANWKMFGRLSSLNSLKKVVKFLREYKKNKFIKIIYCPPSTLIQSMSKILKNSPIKVGAQNCHESQTYGPFTGFINSKMLKNVGAKYVIIGHSENRNLGETDRLINTKIKSALESGLKVIFCIGETLQQKKKKFTRKVLRKQMSLGLEKINNKKDVIIAYEPVWSIGTGRTPKTKELFEIINFIKKENKKNKILYGGSVNTKNINELKIVKNIDGFLIGGASQDTKKFIDIIKKTYN